jgi:hypothetical protein
MMTPSTSMTWHELLSALRSMPERLAALTADASGDDACALASQDEWSVGQVVAHLCAVESPYRARLVHISLKDNPHVAAIGGITGDYDPETPVAILVETFAMLRRETVAFLDSLPPLARGRAAVHAQLGPITLRSQVEALHVHDEGHLSQVARLLQMKGVSHG